MAVIASTERTEWSSYRDRNLIGFSEFLLFSIALKSFVRSEYMLDLASEGSSAGLSLGPVISSISQISTLVTNVR